jgi:Tol biopolymer transport system component
MRNIFSSVLLPLAMFTALCCSNNSASAQTGSVGIFQGHGDVGVGVKPGAATYIPETGQYVISGAGYNVWGDHDEFQYVWKKMTGDFIVYTRAEFLGTWVNYHRKVGWMVRKTLDGNSPHVNAVEHGDGLTSLQLRRTAGGQTEEHKLKMTHANILQLERKGNTYIMRAAIYGDTYETDTVTVDLGDEVYVGLFVGSHNADVVETGVFSNVSITVPYKGESDQRTQMTLGSNLEILDVASGKREVIYKVPYSIQAPNWTPDGKSFIFNDAKGILYNFDIATKTPVKINTDTVTHNNNDHVISFDGKMLGLSSNVRGLGGSITWTVPITGGKPKQITPKGPSYTHGWSPDGKYLVFCGDRGGEFDVYRIPSDGSGPEVRLTDAKGLDDGPEYTPDGQYIYFNSVRSGLMQIWRMKPDGSNQEQVTNDGLNNWFAHISPDGKWFVYLSFLPEETPAGIHPPYKHVYVRLLPIDGKGTPKVLAYVYGGQGSINTPSWSPDSKKIAFISNTDMSGN